ncbi:hypothetical protein [Chitinophaga japonensis]|uniref:Uncharacterized protein n=1 Tax=Chitinophaga japonensis TaxID=104662 RepID=A0A562TCJ1_CHIJA|nr:hypothetical protein [Chitinophaga japonensis]TWI90998.1 hypothetical protein LX66_0359 [Chitinophaga japonensis]
MPNRTIRLLYRKVIDAGSRKRWERHLLSDSYAEFLLQAQYFNQEKKYRTFGELLAYAPGAEKLHFLVTPAITGHLQHLNGKVPDILNNLGQHFLPFRNFRFEIIHSDTRDETKHQVAINFLSEPLTWYDTIGNQLLVGLNGEQAVDDMRPTEMFAMQPFLSIHSLKEP